VTFTTLVLEVKTEEVDPLSDALLDAGALSVTCEDARAETAAEVPPPAEAQGWVCLSGVKL
jgi:ribosomal protein L11 methylase PrmA